RDYLDRSSDEGKAINPDLLMFGPDLEKLGDGQVDLVKMSQWQIQALMLLIEHFNNLKADLNAATIINKIQKLRKLLKDSDLAILFELADTGSLLTDDPNQDQDPTLALSTERIMEMRKLYDPDIYRLFGDENIKSIPADEAMRTLDFLACALGPDYALSIERLEVDILKYYHEKKADRSKKKEVKPVALAFDFLLDGRHSKAKNLRVSLGQALMKTMAELEKDGGEAKATANFNKFIGHIAPVLWTNYGFSKDKEAVVRTAHTAAFVYGCLVRFEALNIQGEVANRDNLKLVKDFADNLYEDILKCINLKKLTDVFGRITDDTFEADLSEEQKEGNIAAIIGNNWREFYQWLHFIKNDPGWLANDPLMKEGNWQELNLEKLKNPNRTFKVDAFTDLMTEIHNGSGFTHHAEILKVAASFIEGERKFRKANAATKIMFEDIKLYTDIYLDALVDQPEETAKLFCSVSLEGPNKTIAQMVYADENLKRHPALVTAFLNDLFIAPKYGKTYNGCVMLANIIGWTETANVENAVVNAFFKLAVGKKNHGLQVLKTIVEILPFNKKKTFLQAFRDVAVQEKIDEALLDRMLKIITNGDTRIIVSNKLPKVLRQTSVEWPENLGRSKAIDLLIENILSNRSIHFTQDGRRVESTDVDSEMEELVVETHFKPNKETRNSPDSLACNVILRRKDGNMLYLKIDKSNRLKIRVVDQYGQTVSEKGESELAELNLSEGQFQEIFYFVLRKLEFVLVRKAKNLPALSEERISSNPPPSDEDTSGATNPNGGDDTPTTPLAGLRQESTHIVDASSDGDELREMRKGELESQRKDEAEIAKKARNFITENKRKLVDLLEKYTSGKLNEIMPERFSELVIYRKVQIEGEQFYEAVKVKNFYQDLLAEKINLGDYFIRVKRAHSKALPYLRRKMSAPLSISEAEKIEEVTGLKVAEGATRCIDTEVKQSQRNRNKAELKLDLFRQSGEAYDFDLSPKPGLLYFETDDNEHNRAIFDMMTKQTPLEIKSSIAKSVRNALRKNLRLARVKYPDDTAYQRVENRMWRFSQLLVETRAAEEMEVRNNFSKKTIQIELEGDVQERVHLALPQVFPFNQTFNQGEFTSLAKVVESL
ncbi:hypothetical protein IT411_02955, partial [Candidatus Peregrinibacteria bacterium]|nr:hypothetical protein [Candidatus Peregrinibacteria bacterium]